MCIAFKVIYRYTTQSKSNNFSVKYFVLKIIGSEPTAELDSNIRKLFIKFYNLILLC